LYFLQDVVSDFWVFRPEVGHTLKGVVTKKSASHISCLVHGVFSVPCHRPIDLEPEIPWFGSKVAIGKTVRFTIRKMDLSQKVPFILGDLIEEECYDEDDPFQSQVFETFDVQRHFCFLQSSTIRMFERIKVKNIKVSKRKLNVNQIF
jgi:hypothetical protein